MAKCLSSLELPLHERTPGTTLTRWLYQELRRAILEGRLEPGARLPATRDFANHYSVSRGTVVAAFEQLQAEQYVSSKIGSGTWVNDLPTMKSGRPAPLTSRRNFPPPLDGLEFPQPARPFRPHEPALAEFPVQLWARLASRRARHASIALLAGRDPRGYLPLRQALAEYLRASRGADCSPDQIVLVSGVQQALDILARLLVHPSESVWMEDPGYFGATIAFRNARAKIVAVPVDVHGLSLERGRKIAPRAKCAYVTPGHQFPLGVMMSLERRLQLLAWARENGAFIIEDDYDSEYRFDGKPVPTLQSLDRHGNVILIGSFNKLLFPALRLGFIVSPPSLIDPLLAMRFGIDQNSVGINQAVLCDFMEEGHLGRHLRRMRELYGRRLAALKDGFRKHLDGIVEIPAINAGVYTAVFLKNGMHSREAENAATAAQVETMALDRFSLKRTDIHGLLLGFAPFEEKDIRNGVMALADALLSAAPRKITDSEVTVRLYFRETYGRS